MFKLTIVLVLCFTTLFAWKADPTIEDKYSVQVLHASHTEQYPVRGHEVSIAYVGRLVENGKEFRRVERDEPYSFVAGSGALRCWNELVTKMASGDKIKVICPSIYAHGSQGYRDIVPPNADVEFEIELVAFGKARSEAQIQADEEKKRKQKKDL